VTRHKAHVANTTLYMPCIYIADLLNGLACVSLFASWSPSNHQRACIGHAFGIFITP
jgi:hypothetical protein